MNNFTNKKISLCGEWKMRWADGQRGGLKHHADLETDDAKWINAEVPGEVHLSLWRAGIIENPYIYANCLSSRWVEDCYWSYRKTFEVSAQELKLEANLVFEGLDYTAKIFLNGIIIAQHENFFYPCTVNVTGKLIKGHNVLVVQLESGLFSVSDKEVKGFYMQDVDTLLHKRMWLRKPQFYFGWDWATRFINIGIHKPVYLEYSLKARITELVPIAEINEDYSKGSINARLFVESVADEQKGEIIVEVLSGNQDVFCICVSTSKEVEIKKGTQRFDIDCIVEQPNLWWPVGHGAQPLYTVKVSLLIDGRIIEERIKKIGFRKVCINQSPHEKGGSYFIIEINGKKIFAKGANFVPADMIIANIDDGHYDILVERALEANFNMLRIWGGGIYESDYFYELCDMKGIMVWQEFIFACAAYPAHDENFVANFKNEAIYNIRRLANHPSLLVWCGNNEQEWHTYNQIKGVLYPDYALYHSIIPRILKAEDHTKYYQPSSPLSPNNEYPNKNDIGDQHPWDIGFDNVDFREYRNMVCRFPNEGGILGPTSIKTMHKCLPEGQKYHNSFSWQIHDNGVEQWFPYSAPDKVVSYWLGKNPKDMSIEEYTYYAGLVQGEGLREYIDSFRKKMFDCAAAIFWMFNDCWPATRSWTIVDYYLNRTPSFYPVKRAFAPISVIVSKEENQIKIYCVNETSSQWEGDLKYGVFTLSGKYVLDKTTRVKIEKNTSCCVATFAADVWDNAGIEDSMAFALLEYEGKLIARNRLILPRYCEMKWTKAHINLRREEGNIIFSSETFAWGVCIDMNGDKALPDNFFDVWPNIEYTLEWPVDADLPEILNVGNIIRNS